MGHIQHLDHIKSEYHKVPKSFKDAHTVSYSGFYYHLGKRVLDITIVIAGVIFFLPFFLVIAAIVKMDGGPIFYFQDRIGKSGKVFRFWKFRSMMQGADEYLASYLASNPEAASEWHISQKLRHDPRVTRFGRLVRKFSLDELPQLWNVLIGDMSLVGPRPMMPNQRSLYPGNHYEIMRPGITGLWQVSERNQVSFASRAHYDTNYAKNVCLWNDIKILLRTVKVVTNGTGC